MCGDPMCGEYGADWGKSKGDTRSRHMSAFGRASGDGRIILRVHYGITRVNRGSLGRLTKLFVVRTARQFNCQSGELVAGQFNRRPAKALRQRYEGWVGWKHRPGRGDGSGRHRWGTRLARDAAADGSLRLGLFQNPRKELAAARGFRLADAIALRTGVRMGHPLSCCRRTPLGVRGSTVDGRAATHRRGLCILLSWSTKIKHNVRQAKQTDVVPRTTTFEPLGGQSVGITLREPNSLTLVMACHIRVTRHPRGPGRRGAGSGRGIAGEWRTRAAPPPPRSSAWKGFPLPRGACRTYSTGSACVAGRR